MFELDVSQSTLPEDEFTDEILKEKTNVFIANEKIEQMAWDVLTYLTRAVENEEVEKVVGKYVRYIDMYPDCNDIRAADWIFVLHTLNFSLWSPKGTDPWTVDGYTGFSALCAAMKRAVDKAKPLWSPKYYKELYNNHEDIEIIFQSDNETRIPLLNSRLELLQNVGTILEEQYKGTFATCLIRYTHVKDLVAELAENFPSYEETIFHYEGAVEKTTIVSFRLKALKLTNDVMCFFQEHKTFKIVHTSELSSYMMFIDYPVFQIFLEYKALYYTDWLKKKLEQNDTLEFGSAEHLEIFACSKQIRYTLYKEFRKLIQKYPTTIPEKIKLFQIMVEFDYHTVIDNFLWDYRHTNGQRLMKNMLFHNVSSVYL